MAGALPGAARLPLLLPLLPLPQQLRPLLLLLLLLLQQPRRVTVRGRRRRQRLSL